MAKKKRIRKSKVDGKTFRSMKPGSMTTRRVKKGPGKGDLVKFTANAAGTKEPGKPKPRRVVKDVKPFRTQKTLPRGRKKTTRRKKR